MLKNESLLEYKKVNIPGAIVVYILGFLNMVPMFIMLIGSFKGKFALIKYPMDLNPFKEHTLDNIVKVLTESDLLLWLKNSMLVSIATALLTIIIGLSAGYALAKIKFRFSGIMFALVISTLMMPKAVLLVPNYMVAKQLNLTNSLMGVVLTSLAPAFGVFLSRQYISTMPTELFDAAEIDGCGELRKFIYVALPLSLPIVGTIGIFAFFGVFNDYIWQLIMLSDKNLYTVSVGLAFFSSVNDKNLSAQMAAALLSTIPLVLVFIVCQRFFIKNATAGAIKG